MNRIDFTKWIDYPIHAFKKILTQVPPGHQRFAPLYLGILAILSTSFFIYRRWNRKAVVVDKKNTCLVNTNISSILNQPPLPRFRAPDKHIPSPSNQIPMPPPSFPTPPPPSPLSMPPPPPSFPTPLLPPPSFPTAPPPPSLPMPPPPLTKKSPGRLHLEKEQKRLQQQIQERANPQRFYSFKEPTPELQKALLQSKTLAGNLIKRYRPVDEVGEITALEKELQEIEKKLAGERVAATEQTKSINPLKVYTNDELNWLIGCYYAFIPESLEEDPCYKDMPSRPIINEAINNFPLLNQAKHLSEFKKYQASWLEYLGEKTIHIKMFIHLLKQRHENREPEPTYKPRSYEEAKKIKKEPRTHKQSGAFLMEDLTNALAKRKNIPSSSPLSKSSPSKLKNAPRKTPPARRAVAPFVDSPSSLKARLQNLSEPQKIERLKNEYLDNQASRIKRQYTIENVLNRIGEIHDQLEHLSLTPENTQEVSKLSTELARLKELENHCEEAKQFLLGNAEAFIARWSKEAEEYVQQKLVSL